MSEGFVGLLFYAFVLIALLYCATNPNTYWSKQYTIYQMSCKDFKSSQLSCNKGFYLNRVSFMPLLEKQGVVGDYGVFVSRVDNCEVFDAKNWSCEQGGKNNEPLSMIDGNFRDLGDKAQDKEYFPVTTQISRIEYNIREWMSFFSGIAGFQKNQENEPITRDEVSDDQNGSKTLASCLYIAAQTYSIPPAVLVGIYKLENGTIGGEIKKEDGSYLLGPMKISSSEIDALSKKWSVEPDVAYRWVKDDACTNVGVASWRFRSYVDETGVLTEAMVKYGEYRGRNGTAYKDEIIKIMREENLLKKDQ